MAETIIVDSSTIKKYLKTGQGVLPTAYEKYQMKISPVTLSEILASKTFDDAALTDEVLQFISKYFSVLNVDKAIALKAARLMRERDLTLATAVIAATSIENGLQLLTNDKKPYEKIPGIKLLDLQE